MEGVTVKAISLTNFTIGKEAFTIASYVNPADGKTLYLEFYTPQWPDGPNYGPRYLLVGRDINNGYVRNIEPGSVSGVPIFTITRRISETTERQYQIDYLRGRLEPHPTMNFIYNVKDLHTLGSEKSPIESP